MASSPDGIIAPELRRLRKLLARKRREPIRIMIATDPTRPVLTFTIPRLLPGALLTILSTLLMAAIILSFNTWSMSGTIRGLKNRVMAMMQLADGVAMGSPAVAQTGLQAGVLGAGPEAAVRVHKASGGQGRFLIEAANGNEQVEVVLDLASGDMDEASYRAVRRLMRCRRTGAEAPIDPRLIELLWHLSQRTGQKIVLISGFRTPSYAAPASYHTRGMAADIRIPGLTSLMVRDLARAMGVHGIGYYPRSQFVHVDMRDEPFFWTDLGAGEGGADPEYEGGKAEPALDGRLIPEP
jgi:uncharacterized protein YcbK (DUF882 family)